MLEIKQGLTMIDKETAKKNIQEHCGEGWLLLIDIVYDNIPEGIIITEVFQKYAALEIRYEGENKHFEELLDNVKYISEKICEVCGKSAGYTIIDGWETTLCNEHFNSAKTKNKYRKND